jgi:hypothetical protein
MGHFETFRTAKNLSEGTLKRQRFAQLATKLRELYLLIGSGQCATAYNRRLAALPRLRPTAPPSGRFAACSGASSHRHRPRLGTTSILPMQLQQGFTGGEMG